MFALMNGCIAVRNPVLNNCDSNYQTNVQQKICGFLRGKNNLLKLAKCSNHKAFELFEFDMKFVSNLQSSQTRNSRKILSIYCSRLVYLFAEFPILD